MLYRHLQQAKETSTAAAKAGLIAVEVMDSGLQRDGDGGLSVVLPRGRRIEVGAGFDGATLQRLILVLERM
jgi:hypothetical protein